MRPNKARTSPAVNRTISTVIVDDSPHAINLLETLIEQNFPQLKLEQSFSDPLKAKSFLEANSCELLLLDVQMPGMNGFELLESLYPFAGQVIFITSHDKFAVEAFKYHALHYLIKPVRLKDLREAIKRLPSEQAHHAPDQVHERAMQTRLAINKVALHTMHGIMFIEMNDIIRCEADGSYTNIITKTQKLVSSRNLKHFEQLLTDRGFFRLHSSHLVNINHISKFVKGDGAYVVMSDGSSVSLSRTRREEFMKLFEGT